jgi:hypothetical protein
MSLLLLPELANEMSGSNRRVAEALEAESLQLEELRGKPGETETLKRRAPQSARGATSDTLSRKVNIVSVWQLALDLLREGLTVEQAQEILQAMQNSIDNWLRVARWCRELCRRAAEAGASLGELEALAAAEEEVGRIGAAVERMHAFVTRARPPIDVGLLEKGRQQIAENCFETAEQIRSGY